MFFKRFLLPLLKKRVYLDYASSTPLDRGMMRSFPKILSWCIGANPSALHKEGVALRSFLSKARSVAAHALGAHTDEVFFTSSATESDNLAIQGYINAAIARGVPPEKIALYTTPFEHAAVAETVRHVHAAIRVCSLVQEDGYVVPKAITIPEDVVVVLVSVVYIQNEIGTVQPVKEIAKRLRALRKAFPEKEITFHIDATQAPLTHDLNVLRLGADMLSVGATKLYTEKGVGLFYKRRGVQVSPLLFGGNQERGIRPGTEPVQTIHSFSYALRYAQEHREEALEHFETLKAYFKTFLKERVPNARITEQGETAPHIVHVVFDGMDSELLVLELDARGISVSSKSACKNEEDEQSSVLSLLYPEGGVGALRISFGRTTTKKDLRRCVTALAAVLKKYR